MATVSLRRESLTGTPMSVRVSNSKISRAPASRHTSNNMLKQKGWEGKETGREIRETSSEEGTCVERKAAKGSESRKRRSSRVRKLWSKAPMHQALPEASKNPCGHVATFRLRNQERSETHSTIQGTCRAESTNMMRRACSCWRPQSQAFLRGCLRAQHSGCASCTLPSVRSEVRAEVAHCAKQT